MRGFADARKRDYIFIAAARNVLKTVPATSGLAARFSFTNTDMHLIAYQPYYIGVLNVTSAYFAKP